jgi:putative transposase
MVHSKRILWLRVSFCEGEVQLVSRLIIIIKQQISSSLHALQKRFLNWIKPLMTSFLFSTLADLPRGRSALIAENALLRQQHIILRRQIKRPVYRRTDRFFLVILARLVRSWKQALFLVQPETDLALAP